MRQYNITKLGFSPERLREMCVDNFNAISASIKSIISEVRANRGRIDRNEEVLSRAVVTDANGNIAYGGAIIPDDVSTTFRHYFYSDNIVKIISPNGLVVYEAKNAFLNTAGDWEYILTGDAYLDRSFQSNSELKSLYYASGTSGSTILWVKVFNIDSSGNVNIKTGSTYTATL